MSTSYTSRPTTAEVVVHATKFCLRSFSRQRGPSVSWTNCPQHIMYDARGWEQYEAWAADGADPAPVTTSRPAALARPSCGGAEFPLSPSPGLAVKRATRTKSHPALGGSPPSVAMQEDEALAPLPSSGQLCRASPPQGSLGEELRLSLGAQGRQASSTANPTSLAPPQTASPSPRPTSHLHAITV